MLTENEELYGRTNKVSLRHVHGQHLTLNLGKTNEVDSDERSGPYISTT
jgi:hypothetical protein